MMVHHAPHAVQGMAPHLGSVLRQVFRLDNLDGSQRRGTGDGVLLVGVVPQRLISRDIEALIGNQGGQGKDSSAKAFADHQHVRHNREILAGEHFPGTPEGVRDFVKDE